MHVQRTAAGDGGMQIHLPGLAHGIGLDEVAIIVDVEAAIGGMVLEIGDEGGDIDDSQEPHTATK